MAPFNGNRAGPEEAAELLTTGDIARYCSVSTNAVKKWIRQGDLPAFQTPGRHFRVHKEEFRRFLLRHGMPVSPGFFPSRRKRVLIADDEGMIRDLVCELVLSAAEGAVDVEIASDGYEALLKVGSFQPDLLILDLKMPRMDGFEACRSIRSNPDMQHIHILAMSAFTANGNRERILEAGAIRCFDKPLSVAPFQETVRRLLNDEDLEQSGVA